MCSDKLHTASASVAENTRHQPVQDGYEACFIPPEVRQYTGEPLYILVAWWCLQQRGWVNRCQISDAFKVPARRASYLMSYLRGKSRRVVCETRKVPTVNNICRYEIYVTAVLESQAREKTIRTVVPEHHRTRRRVGNADTSQANALWNRMRAGRDVPDENVQEADDE